MPSGTQLPVAEAGAVGLESRPVDLRRVVRDVVRLFRAVVSDEALGRWLSDPAARFEVPISIRLDDADGAVLRIEPAE